MTLTVKTKAVALFAAAFFVLAAGCNGENTGAKDPATPADVKEQAPDSGALPPPTPADITIHVQADAEGSTLALKTGDRFAVELVGVPTAGYLWAPAEVPPFLELIGEYSGPTIAAQMEPGFAGGNHWEVMVFEAKATGSAEFRFEQRRPWETDEPAAATLTFTVTVE